MKGRTKRTSKGGRVVRYRVQVEKGLTVAGDRVSKKAFAKQVHTILIHRRGWQRVEGVRFVQVTKRPDVTVVLASPRTTDALCWPLLTRGKLSCRNGGRTVLNARRWFSGATPYGDDLVNYRRYLVNHEMGHFLGYGHASCPRRGAVAPVMVQQTKSLQGCKKGPWPAGGRQRRAAG